MILDRLTDHTNHECFATRISFSFLDTFKVILYLNDCFYTIHLALGDSKRVAFSVPLVNFRSLWSGIIGKFYPREDE